MSRPNKPLSKAAHHRAALKSAGRSGAVIKARNLKFPDLVPERSLQCARAPQPWPLNEEETPSPPAPLPHAGEGSFSEMPPVHFLGCLTAAERGVQGDVSLDVLLHPDGSCEIGPFVFARPQVTQLLKLVTAADVLREVWA